MIVVVALLLGIAAICVSCCQLSSRISQMEEERENEK